MTQYYLFVASILFCTSAIAQDYSKRKILLLAEHNQNSDLMQQENIFNADSSGLYERDIIITVITPTSDKKRFDQFMKNKKGFRMILIGKDGSEKFTSDKPVSLQQLYGLIDAMPMRKYEIETRSKNK